MTETDVESRITNYEETIFYSGRSAYIRRVSTDGMHECWFKVDGRESMQPLTRAVFMPVRDKDILQAAFGKRQILLDHIFCGQRARYDDNSGGLIYQMANDSAVFFTTIVKRRVASST